MLLKVVTPSPALETKIKQSSGVMLSSGESYNAVNATTMRIEKQISETLYVEP